MKIAWLDKEKRMSGTLYILLQERMPSETGVLVDASTMAKKAGVKFPTAITSTIRGK